MHRTWLELILECRSLSGYPPPAPGTDPSRLFVSPDRFFAHVLIVDHPLFNLIFPHKWEGQKTMFLH
jgi:hypothetical protein